MPTVFPGWYIRVTKVSFFSKYWEVVFWDGLFNKLSTRKIIDLRIGSPLRGLPHLSKSQAEDLAGGLLEQICKDWLERCRKEQPEVFNEILKNGDTVWKTDNMGTIPVGRIAQKLYPEAAKATNSNSEQAGESHGCE